MGVSILVEWPGSTQEQQEGHPGFRNDDQFWAAWVVNVMKKPKLISLLESFEVEALLDLNTTDLDPKNILSDTPEDFEKAATTLRERLQCGTLATVRVMSSTSTSTCSPRRRVQARRWILSWVLHDDTAWIRVRPRGNVDRSATRRPISRRQQHRTQRRRVPSIRDAQPGRHTVATKTP